MNMRLRSPSSRIKFWTKISRFDIIWTILCPFLALLIRGKEFFEPEFIENSIPNTYEYALLTIITSLPMLIIFRVNEGVIFLFTARDLLSLLKATIASLIFSISLIFFINRLDGVPRSVPFIYGLLLITGLVSYRLIVKALYEKQHVKDILKNDNKIYNDLTRSIIIGLDVFAISAIRLTDAQIPRTNQVVAAFSVNNKHAGRTISGVRVFGELNEMDSIIEEYNIHGIKIHEVWLSDNSYKYMVNYLDEIYKYCNKSNLKVTWISNKFSLPQILTESNKDCHNGGNELIKNKFYLKIKRIIDIIFVLLIGLVSSFFVPILCTLILIDMGAPIFFWQEREGMNGKKFLVFKFRTLKHPIGTNGEFLDSSERQSVFGDCLRKYRLDEIPQLLNILVGEMSFIGPRPLLPIDQPVDAKKRLSVRPGITGWAQIHGGELLNVDDKNALDCFYVDNISFGLDLLIVLKTIKVLFIGVKMDLIQLQRARDYVNDN